MYVSFRHFRCIERSYLCSALIDHRGGEDTGIEHRVDIGAIDGLFLVVFSALVQHVRLSEYVFVVEILVRSQWEVGVAGGRVLTLLLQD
jgi:hypothetical protein